MSEINVIEPEITGNAEESAQTELSPEQKKERKAFLESKLEDYKIRAKNITKELKELN